MKRWSFYCANLDSVIGSGQGKTRLVIIISGDEINAVLNTVNVLPLTSRKGGRKVHPHEVLIKSEPFGLNNDSLALCHQIRTIDKRRMADFY